MYLLLKLLLPGVVKRVYNLNNKQLVKLYSQVRWLPGLHVFVIEAFVTGCCQKSL